MKYNTIIIIGAPRSGTNMLRDILSQLDEVGTWPCDEINYIWRHGNIHEDSDEFHPNLATPNVQKYIQGQFNKLAKNGQLKWVVEKTCANSLRVPFIDRVIPKAKYIFIYRNGLDALASANLRWSADLDIPYLLKKIRYVPPADLPFYGLRYFWNRIYRLISRDKRLAFWGPQLSNMTELLERYNLNQVCALQWERCVVKSDEAFRQMDPERVVRVSYEDLVSRPIEELERICKHIGIPVDREKIKYVTRRVSSSSIGKGIKQLDDETIREMYELIGGTLERFGYR